jgi:hypothetical protein
MIAFRTLPGIDSTPRARLDVRIGGAEDVPLACLVDTGSLRTRLPRWLADVAGIGLDRAPQERINVGGRRGIVASHAHVELAVDQAKVRAACGVWFCEGWEHPFGLLGQEDFLRLVRLVVESDKQRFSVEAVR